MPKKIDISDICHRPLSPITKLNLGPESEREALRLGLIIRTEEVLKAYADKEQTQICIKKLRDIND